MELYIHIPFCVRKCRYCDFLSFASDACVREKYVDQLIREIESIPEEDAGQCPENAAPRLNLTGRTVETIFIGGGTPSLLPPSAVERILAAVRQVFRVEPDAEITMEANPGTLTPDSAAGYRNAGVNRLSLGLQSASEEELRLLGRIHTREQFLQSFRAARDAGFDNINVDLMSALPGQSVESYRCTLKKVCELGPEHISAYSLIIEDGTLFAKRYRQDAAKREAGEKPQFLPSEDEERQMYEDTAEILSEYGYHRYEISNYAKAGYVCRHNVGYWKRVDYIGFGLGASTLQNPLRYKNTDDLQEYLNRDFSKKELLVLTKDNQIEETLFLGLRMMEGVSLSAFEEHFHCPLTVIYQREIQKLTEKGLLRIEEDRISLTKKGIDLSNMVLSEFLLG